ncbi:unnamed protein product [Ceutorhynchus assimilis]|uniref:SMP-30/Gluconolactonase/LRE-like region domain-containing protein n=1 Tax=Ceutorhynchus assimilis TaxID=467358 RepID=A0A9N9MTU2_9CUCU|nr:unnamed protein product [Ceutorhynchus assimilis]
MLKFLCVLVGIIAFTNGSNSDLPAVTQITEPVDLAEGPIWDGRKNILFYVDILTGRVFSYNYNTREVNHVTLNGEVTPVILTLDENLLLVGLNRDLVALEWDGTNELVQTKVISTVSQQFPGSRFNDGKADKKGRLWIGTVGPWVNGVLSPDEGVFYKVTKENLENPSVEIAPVNNSNGLAWNAANDQLFYIDTNSNQVAGYDFDLEKCSISNHRVVFDLKYHPELAGSPDGMAIDENDNLWVALYGGGCVIQVNPTSGELLQTIAIPARDVSSVMWGGPNLDILFVTTSRISLSEEEKLKSPAAGSVFAVTNLKTKGIPVFNADII